MLFPGPIYSKKPSMDNEIPLYSENKAPSPFLAGSAQFLVLANQRVSTKTCAIHILGGKIHQSDLPKATPC